IAAAKGELKTRPYHKTLRGALGMEGVRRPGDRKAPVLVALDPAPGVTPSDKPPVRITWARSPPNTGRSGCLSGP
ncbi:MAG: hypothetical protein ACO2YV_08540, partial [Pseudomonadales bacterium]